MKYIASTSREGYSIIAAVLMVGFLLILATSTLNLVLQEMQDGRGRQWYLKAYAGAEWALELALLDIKVQWYGFDDDTFKDTDNETLWNGTRNPKIGYEFNSRVTSHSGTLAAQWIDIIPLFATWALWVESISSIDFDVTSWDIVWNIITQDSGVSWSGNFTENTTIWEKTLTTWTLWFSSVQIWSILSWQDYLILQNLSNTSATYSLSWTDWFTLPRAEVFSSAQVWKYKQNLKTVVDNTEFLWILRYSVYSWE